MAETWYEYFLGDEARRQQAVDRQRAEYDRIRSLPEYRWLERQAHAGRLLGGKDPREVMMSVTADSRAPVFVGSEAGDDAAYAVDYAWNFGARPRDTMFAAMQQAAKGNADEAADLALRAAKSPLLPSEAAGGYGQPDDWRQYVSPGNAMVIDVATDPMSYGTMGIKPAAKVLGRVGVRALRGLGPAIDAARYGRGAPAFLEDAAGHTIRRLRNAESVPSTFLIPR